MECNSFTKVSWFDSLEKQSTLTLVFSSSDTEPEMKYRGAERDLVSMYRNLNKTLAG